MIPHAPSRREHSLVTRAGGRVGSWQMTAIDERARAMPGSRILRSAVITSPRPTRGIPARRTWPRGRSSRSFPAPKVLEDQTSYAHRRIFGVGSRDRIPIPVRNVSVLQFSVAGEERADPRSAVDEEQHPGGEPVHEPGGPFGTTIDSDSQAELPDYAKNPSSIPYTAVPMTGPTIVTVPPTRATNTTSTVHPDAEGRKGLDVRVAPVAPVHPPTARHPAHGDDLAPESIDRP